MPASPDAVPFCRRPAQKQDRLRDLPPCGTIAL